MVEDWGTRMRHMLLACALHVALEGQRGRQLLPLMISGQVTVDTMDIVGLEVVSVREEGEGTDIDY